MCSDGRVETSVEEEQSYAPRPRMDPAERARIRKASDALIDAVATCKRGGATRDLEDAIQAASAAGVRETDIKHAERVLDEVVRSIWLVVSWFVLSIGLAARAPQGSAQGGGGPARGPRGRNPRRGPGDCQDYNHQALFWCVI